MCVSTSVERRGAALLRRPHTLLKKYMENKKYKELVEEMIYSFVKLADEVRKKERDRIEKQLRTLRTTDKRKYDVVLWADVVSILKEK